jgi:hypothetical protein
VTTYTTLVIALAAIPVGFLLYQLYYFFYKPFSRLTGAARLDRGALVLRYLRPQDLEVVRALLAGTDDLHDDDDRLELEPQHISADITRSVWLPPGLRRRIFRYDPVSESTAARASQGSGLFLESIGVTRDEYSKRWYAHWRVVRFLIRLAAEYPGAKGLSPECLSAMDEYHALGSVRMTIGLSLTCSLVYIWLRHWGAVVSHPQASVTVLASLLLLNGAAYYVMHRQRRHKLDAAAAFIGPCLRSFFLASGNKLRRRAGMPPLQLPAVSTASDGEPPGPVRGTHVSTLPARATPAKAPPDGGPP